MTAIQKLVDYVRSAKAEALKVSWPSKQDTIRYASLVIGVSAVLALVFSIVDFGFTKLFEATLLQQVRANRAAQQAPAAPVQPTTAPAEQPKVDIDAVPVSAEGDNGAVNITPTDLEAAAKTKTKTE